MQSPNVLVDFSHLMAIRLEHQVLILQIFVRIYQTDIIGQFSNPRENRQVSNHEIKWVRSQQDLYAETRTANIKTVEALEARNRTAERAEEMQNLRINKWRPGDLYTPHDLSPEEMGKRRQPRVPNQDAFDVLGINPLHEYKVNHLFAIKAQRKAC